MSITDFLPRISRDEYKLRQRAQCFSQWRKIIQKRTELPEFHCAIAEPPPELHIADKLFIVIKLSGPKYPLTMAITFESLNGFLTMIELPSVTIEDDEHIIRVSLEILMKLVIESVVNSSLNIEAITIEKSHGNSFMTPEWYHLQIDTDSYASFFVMISDIDLVEINKIKPFFPDTVVNIKVPFKVSIATASIDIDRSKNLRTDDVFFVEPTAEFKVVLPNMESEIQTGVSDNKQRTPVHVLKLYDPTYLNDILSENTARQLIPMSTVAYVNNNYINGNCFRLNSKVYFHVY